MSSDVPLSGGKKKSVLEAKWQQIRLRQLLQDLLGEIDTETLDGLQQELEWLSFANGDLVFSQGDPPDGMYLVANGRLRIVQKDEGGQERLVAEVVNGETVGEFALLTDEPRSATVYALRESSVVRFTAETFEQLAAANPRFMRQITRMIVERQQPASPRRKRSSLALAIIPASASVDGKTFVHQLAGALSEFGSLEHLDADRFDTLYGQEGSGASKSDQAGHSAVAAWLERLESECDFVLYLADPSPTAWTQRCIGHADRVLLLADPAGDPRPGPAELAASQLQLPLQTELALWHPAETEWPTGTAAWLAPRRLHAHHHVRRGSAAHMARLARRLAGQAVALVFSGGAARALSHLGVFRAILELEIPIDYIAGTSMGAITAGAIAREYSYAEMEALARQMTDYGIQDITLPLAALTASKHVTEICQQVFGGYEIEDLWLPYFCVSTSLSLAEPVIHRQGSLWRAIRASMSIPGVFLPVVEDGNVLVDGGVMNNFPAGLMAEFSQTEHIIGVHVSPYKEHMRHYDYEMSLSGWRILFNRLNPFAKKLRTPSMLETMMRAAEVNGVRLSRQQEQEVELLIQPDVRQFKLTDYSAWKEIFQAGYEAGLEPLQAWKDSWDSPDV